MSEKTYDILKYTQRIVIPALITFLTTVLGLCKVDAELIAIITGILAAIDTLMAAMLQVEYNNYTVRQFLDTCIVGDIDVDEEEEDEE